jgi:hypothetical protein
MNREIAPGIHWLYEAGPDRTERFELAERRPDWYEPGREAYVPQCAYLLEGTDGTLLFDTLSPASTGQVLDAIDDLVGDRGLDYLVKALRDSPAEYDNGEVTTAGGFWSGDHYHEQKWYVRFEVSPEKDSDEEDEPKLMTDGGVDTDDPVPDEVQETAEEQNRVIAALDDADLVHDVPTGVALSAAQSGYEDEEANDALPVGMYAYQTMMDTLTILYSPPAAKAQAWSGNYACVWEAFEDANDEPKFVTVDGPEKGRTIREYVRKTYPDHVGDWTFQHNNAEDELFVVYQTDEAEMYLVDDGCGDPYRVMLYEDSWGEAPAVELAVFPSEGEAWSYMKDRMDEGEDQR